MLLAATAPAALSFQWAGDLTPGSRYGVPGDGGRAQLAQARPLLSQADLTLANLEGTYSRGGRSKCGGGGGKGGGGGAKGVDCFAFQAPPGNAPALRWAGIEAVNQANNHAFDFGASGQAQTLAALQRAQVLVTGRPGQVTLAQINNVNVALLGFAPYPWASPLLDIGRARRQIAAAARRASVVIVAIHAGAEGADKDHVPHGHEHAFGEDRGNARAFAHAAIDAGADLVVGSGPHVIRGVERYRGRLVAYSLGNFAGWHNFGMGGRLSLSGILRVDLAADGTPTDGTWISMRLTGPGIPVPDRSGASAKLAAKLSRGDFGANAGVRPSGALVP
ncbi:MAG TPA: CapA family protein [Solirubrobacteraceae bacterium]|nr:CapA family protein [Solirubrobacteraceae bacterium]